MVEVLTVLTVEWSLVACNAIPECSGLQGILCKKAIGAAVILLASCICLSELLSIATRWP
jgi:hypothetical protein